MAAPHEIAPEAMAILRKAQPVKAQRPRPEISVLGIEDLLALEIPEARMLIEDVQVERGTQLSVGASKSGKTIMGVAKALAVVTGKPLFGYYRVLQQGPAMIIEQDDPGGAGSIKAIVQRAGIKGGVPLYVVPRVPFSFGPAFIEWLEKQITDKFLRFVLLDSYTALRGSRSAGGDIVKAEQADLTMLDALGKRTGCGLEVIHHASKGSAGLDWSQQAGGTFAMGAAVEGQTHISRFPELDGNAPERLVRIRLRHGKDVEMLLRFQEETLDFAHVMEGGAAAYYPLLLQIRSAFGDQSFTPKELTAEMGISRATAHRTIDRLYRSGAIEKRGFGQYALAKLRQ